MGECVVGMWWGCAGGVVGVWWIVFIWSDPQPEQKLDGYSAESTSYYGHSS